MNSKIINVIMFAAGAAIGSAVTWKFLKDKYEKIVQEEIKSVKEVFADRFSDSSEEPSSEKSDDEMEEDPLSDYRKINWDDLEDLDPSELEEEEYQAEEADKAEYEYLSNIYKEGGADNMPSSEPREPYIIEPIEFGELDGYKTFELTYYEDGILEDEDYEIVRNPEEILGPDALGSFGEYEDDSVFVRNERLRADFQILKDYRTYDEARSIGPGRVNDE